MPQLAFAVAWLLTALGSVQATEVSAARSDSKGSNVIAKVVEMLQNEKGKIIEDLKEERSNMEEYFKYCDTEQSDKQYAIKRATSKIEDLAATIEQANGQIEEFNEEIVELADDISDRQGELDKAKKLRDDTHAEFKQREHEQEIMIGELEQMEYALKHQMLAMTTPPPVEFVQDGGQEALLQISDIDKEVKNVLKDSKALGMSMMDMSMKDIRRFKELMTRTVHALGLDPEATVPATAAFLQQSNSASSHAHQPEEISMDMLDKAGISDAQRDSLYAFASLKGKAEAALQRERDNDVASQHDFMMEKQDLVKTMETLQEKMDEAKANVQDLTETAAAAEKEKGDTEAAKAADEKFLKALMTECHLAADAWDKRETSATEEQAAIDKACEILSSRVTVFLQLSRNVKEVRAKKDIRRALLSHLKKMGAQSKSLSVLNLISFATHSPFDKINGLIKELIANLQKEAAEDANKHAYCEAEKKKNGESSAKINKRLDELNTRLDGSNARKQELTDNVEELTDQIAEMNSQDAEALKVREEQHATFVKAEADFKEATSAVEDAMNVLKDFYDNAAFLQQPKAAPKIGGASKDAAGGILSILDMMATEFADTVAELQTTEREQKDAYEKQTNDNEVSKAAKTAEIKASESELASLGTAISETSQDLRGVQKELDALNEYIEKLKGTCVNQPMPYQERVKRRNAEIEGLKQAMDILNGETVLVQIRNLRHSVSE